MTPEQEKEGAAVVAWLVQSFENFASIIGAKIKSGQLVFDDRQVRLAIQVLQEGDEKLRAAV